LYPVLAVGLALSAFVLYRHRANIGRLLHGTENKIGGTPA
jgi:glycerol-3-phosphate acyltransferase PlsY